MFSKGRYHVRAAVSAQDVSATQALRALAFGTGTPDHDAHDARCTHMMVEHCETGQLVCCFRVLPVTGADALGNSYAAQFYDLGALAAFGGPMLELGRFCMHPAHHDPDILRVAWGALTAQVDRDGIEMLFGCSSFAGIDPGPYYEALALLRVRHLAPPRWRPGVLAPEVYRFAARLRRKPDARRAMQVMPPLLRTYLAMGGWVSDHAVIDRGLGTFHVFTGLEIAAIPPARKRLLRAVAG